MAKKIISTLFVIFISVISIIGIVVIVKFFIFWSVFESSDDTMKKEDVYSYIINNHTEIETAVSEYVNTHPEAINCGIGNSLGLDLPKGIKDVYVGRDTVRFNCGGYDTGPDALYTGVYYIYTDKAPEFNGDTADFSLFDFYISGQNGEKFEKNGDGWLWKQEKGDNQVYIESIVGNFYYYTEEL